MEKISDRLENKTAVVTGAGAGIGKGYALMFARHGARVIGIDISAEAVDQTEFEAQRAGLNFSSVGGMDLTKEDKVLSVKETVQELTNNKVDILVNAAAFSGARSYRI